MKLALKLAGRPIKDDEAGPITWEVWRRKHEPGQCVFANGREVVAP
jgi:hypothetical protein